MKKIIASLGFLALLAPFSLAIDETMTADIDVMRSQGYSESALRVIDTARAHQQAMAGNYQRRFINTHGGAYKILKLYVDPSQEDDQFGEHQINFANTWLGNPTHYVTTKEDRGNSNRGIPNL